MSPASYTSMFSSSSINMLALYRLVTRQVAHQTEEDVVRSIPDIWNT
jgi:hypothetical protein